MTANEFVLALREAAVGYPNRHGPGRTLLMLAAREAPDAVVKDLLATLQTGGADLERRNELGETALHWLLGSANRDGTVRPLAFEWLLTAGADPMPCDR